MVEKIFNWLNLAMHFLKIIATPLDKRDMDLVMLGDKLVMLGDKLVISLTHEHVVVNNYMFNSSTDKLIEQQHVQSAPTDKVAELKNELATIFIQVSRANSDSHTHEISHSQKDETLHNMILNTMLPFLAISTDKRMRDSEYRTLTALYSLVYQHNANALPPLMVQSLAHMRAVTTRTIYFHLNRLSQPKFSSSQSLPTQQVVISLLGESFFKPREHVGTVVINNSTGSFKETISTNKTVLDKQHDQHVPSQTEIEKLKADLTKIFIEAGRPEKQAYLFATSLINKHTYQTCLDQLLYLDRRCELFSQNGGLRTNRSAVLIASLKTNWSPPPAPGRFAALAGGFYTFKHEYIILFFKAKKSNPVQSPFPKFCRSPMGEWGKILFTTDEVLLRFCIFPSSLTRYFRPYRPPPKAAIMRAT